MFFYFLVPDCLSSSLLRSSRDQYAASEGALSSVPTHRPVSLETAESPDTRAYRQCESGYGSGLLSGGRPAVRIWGESWSNEGFKWLVITIFLLPLLVDTARPIPRLTHEIIQANLTSES